MNVNHWKVELIILSLLQKLIKQTKDRIDEILVQENAINELIETFKA